MVELTVKNSDIELSGASNAAVNITDEMDIKLSDASKLEYAGQPVLSGVDISGASTLDTIE